MVGIGMIEIQGTQIIKFAETCEEREPQVCLPPARREGRAKLMRIYIGGNDKWHDKPLYQALVESLRANDIAGVTVYQGILGYGANRRIHQQTALNLSHDHPIMLSIVETEEKLLAFVP